MKLGDNVRDPSYFQPYPIVYITFCLRYSPLSLEVVESRTNVKNFWPSIFQEGWSQLFYSRLLARFTVHRLAKFD